MLNLHKTDKLKVVEAVVLHEEKMLKSNFKSIRYKYTVRKKLWWGAQFATLFLQNEWVNDSLSQ